MSGLANKSNEIERLWAILRVEGQQGLTGPQRDQLAQWLGSRPSRDGAQPMVETLEEARHVLDLAATFLAGESNGLAAASARLALAELERLAPPNSGVRSLALILAAHAALRAVPALEPKLPGDTERLIERVRALTGEMIDEARPVAEPLYAYGQYLHERRRYGDAVAVFRLLLQLLERQAGAGAADRAVAREELAISLAAEPEGSLDDAERLLRSALEIRRDGDDAAREGLWRSWLGLASVLWRRRQWPEAEAAFIAAEAAARDAFGADSAHAAACTRDLREFRRDWLYDREDGRLFGWALREAAGDPFTRAVSALLAVSGVVANRDDADMMVAHAGRLQARAGAIDAALDLAEERLTWARAEWDGAGVYRDVVDTLLTAGRREAARAVLARGFAFAAGVGMMERSDPDAAQRDLVEAIEQIDHPGLADLLRQTLAADKLNLMLERDLERAVRHRDPGAVAAALAGWDWQEGAPDEWLLRDIGRLAAEAGDHGTAQAMAERLRGGGYPHLEVDVLLAAGFDDAAEAVLARLEPGWPRANGLAVAAAHAGAAGNRSRFEALARGVLAELPPDKLESTMALHSIAEGARSCLTLAEGQAWADAHLTHEPARRTFRALLDPTKPYDPERPSIAELPALADALGARDWDGALAGLGSVGNGYLDLIHAEMLAEPAAAAGRGDVALQALRFALARLPGPFADKARRHLTKEEFRFLTARRLGETARRLLGADARAAFAEDGFAQAARLDDMASAAALVVAAGLACRP